MITRRYLMDPWRDDLVTELRMRGLPGRRIGEALAEVDAHCADSGQTPDDAFGDPAAYAESLLAVHAAAPGQGFVTRVLRPTGQAFATLAGVLAFLDGVDAVAHGQPAEVTAGQLTAVAVGTAVFPFVITMVFKPGVFRRRLLLAAVVMVPTWLIAGLVAVWKQPVAHPAAWFVLLTGLFLLTAAWWPVTSERVFADRIIDPRTGAEPFTTPRLLLAVIRWFLPAALLLIALATVLIPVS
jgi:hypothetical protein